MDRDALQNEGLRRSQRRAPGAISVARLPKFERDVARPAFLAHVVLSTNDVSSMSQWYTNVLGAESTFAASGLEVADVRGKIQNVDVDFVTFDREHHRIAFANIGGKPSDPPPARTLNHIAFTYAHIGELINTYLRLKSEDVLPIRTVHHGPTVSLYYLDPDGNRVELQVDAFSNPEELNGWFASGAFEENQIGNPFEFTTLIERYDAGDDEQYLISTNGFIADYMAGRFTASSPVTPP